MCVSVSVCVCVCVCTQSLSHVQLFVTLWTVAYQALLSMGFSRQEYWSGLPCPPPGDLSHPGIEAASLASPALASSFSTTEPPGKPFKEGLTHSYRNVKLNLRSIWRVFPQHPANSLFLEFIQDSTVLPMPEPTCLQWIMGI